MSESVNRWVEEGRMTAEEGDLERLLDEEAKRTFRKAGGVSHPETEIRHYNDGGRNSGRMGERAAVDYLRREGFECAT